MSKLAITAFFLFISFGLFAQDCDLYIPMEEGKGFQYQNFNRRDRLEGVNEVIIKNVNRKSDRTEAVMQARYYDSRERLQHEGEYMITCKGNELIIDMQSIIDQTQMESFEGMEVSLTTIDNLTIPGNISVGDKLPDGKMIMKVSMGGRTMSEMNFTTQNRTVEGKETITTPAGTFESYKITYENVMDTRTMGITRKTVTKGVEYFSPGVGNVRSEFYDDRDRLQSYTVLSKIY
ncbi:MAG: hypothetical protein EA361_18775 [Bacteroidetes bacterium]|nr:MAG: hypothetical protein EA361_18775 [Bacteroidota bacterium]